MALQTLDDLRMEDPFLAPRAAGDDPDPLLVLAKIATILKKNRKLILYFGLAFAIAAGIVAVLTATRYTATSSFIPPTNSSNSGLAALAGQLSSLGGGSSLLSGPKTSGDLYIGMLNSHSIAHLMITRFHLMSVYKVSKESQAERALASHATFTSGSKDPIVSISVTDTDPARARDMANAFLDALRETSSRLALTENSQRRQFYEERLAMEKNQLADAEVALKQTEEHSGLIAPAGQTVIELNALAQRRSQIAAKEVQLASLLRDDAPENPEVLRVKEELSTLRAQVVHLQSGKAGLTDAPSTSQVPALQLEYIRRDRDVKYHEALFEILAKQYEAARLDEARDPELQVLDRATLPDTKSGPHRIMITGIGFLAGLLMGAVWSLFRSRTPRPAGSQ